MELAKEKDTEAFTGQEPWDFPGLLQEERLGKEVQMFSRLPHSHAPSLYPHSAAGSFAESSNQLNLQATVARASGPFQFCRPLVPIDTHAML